MTNCLPTGQSFLWDIYIDLKNFYTNPRCTPENTFLGQLEDLARIFIVIPAHAITAVIFAPIAIIYDLAMTCISRIASIWCNEHNHNHLQIWHEPEKYCFSSIADLGLIIVHILSSICPCNVYLSITRPPPSI
jgi:hypothetical protein